MSREEGLKTYAGRKYNSIQDNYQLPADELEINRLNAQYRALALLLGAPLPQPLIDELRTAQDVQILDVGCGTASWSMDLAPILPNAKFLNIDLVDIQSPNLPSNVSFLKHDILKPFPPDLREESYDVVHAQYLITGIRDYSTLLGSLQRLLKPGGKLVLVEPELTINAHGSENSDSVKIPLVVRKMNDICIQAMSKIGIEIEAAKNLPNYLQATQAFADVKAESFSLPTTPWPEDPELKQIGTIQLANSHQMTYTIRGLVLKTGLIAEEEFDRLNGEYVKELDEGTARLSMRVWRVVATKRREAGF